MSAIQAGFLDFFCEYSPTSSILDNARHTAATDDSQATSNSTCVALHFSMQYIKLDSIGITIETQTSEQM